MAPAEVWEVIDFRVGVPWPVSRAFLGDLFTPAVREGAARWGRPVLRRPPDQTSATRGLPGGCRASVALGSKSVVACFLTPQQDEADREEGC
ncbi:hypothetical protein J7S33_28755 [Saccharothrix algeriensis]|nr:hypothetical protein J7S33_28755 [Saccharothrix algeriensis]